MGKLAVTITAYALVDESDHDERLGEIVSGFERGLQQADAEYIGPQVTPGIPPEISDQL